MLERDRLVRYDLVQRGKGRPSYVYSLSSEADNLFPKNYAALAKELLGYLAAEDDQQVIELFDQRAQRRIRQAQEPAGRQVADRPGGRPGGHSAQTRVTWRSGNRSTRTLTC